MSTLANYFRRNISGYLCTAGPLGGRGRGAGSAGIMYTHTASLTCQLTFQIDIN